MISYPALRGLRIGCVQYLNAKPLIHRYPGPVQFDHPSRLAEGIARGDLDVALVPIFEGLGARNYLLVDDVAIASNGPVHSVYLAYSGELRDIRGVALDPASLTSVHLLQVLLAEFHQIRPVCVDMREPGLVVDARLLIGNQAIDYRENAPAGTHFLDLGEEWTRQTGLPFVYAAWLMRRGVPDVRSVASDFRQLKEEGVQSIAEIVGLEPSERAAFAHRYLTQHIRFDLREREKEGILRFRSLLEKHGFLKGELAPLEYI